MGTDKALITVHCPDKNEDTHGGSGLRRFKTEMVLAHRGLAHLKSDSRVANTFSLTNRCFLASRFSVQSVAQRCDLLLRSTRRLSR